MTKFETQISTAGDKKAILALCETVLEETRLDDLEKMLETALEYHFHQLIEPLKELYLDNGDLDVKILILDFFRGMQDLSLSEFLLDQLELPDPANNSMINNVTSYMFLHTPQTESAELQVYILDALETCGQRDILSSLEVLAKQASSLLVERKSREVIKLIRAREKNRETGKLSVTEIDEEAGHLSKPGDNDE